MDEHDMKPLALGAAARRLPAEPPKFIALRLVVPDAALSVELDRPEMVLGRHSEADVRLPMPDVSRRHCRFVYSDGEWHVWDLDSLNGVFVNGSRVKHAVLQAHDTVVIGGFTFEVRLPENKPESNATEAMESPMQVLRSIADALPRETARIDYRERKAS